MLLENFPQLRIVESETDVREAFEQCSMLVHGSAPIVADRNIRAWKEKTGKPYGLYGVTVDGLWTEDKKTTFVGSRLRFLSRFAFPVFSVSAESEV